MVESLSNILPINIVGVVSGTLASGTPTNIFSRAAVQNVVIINENAIAVELVGSGGGGGGTSDHAALDNLDFASAAHTGFASTAALSSASGTLSTEIDDDITTHAAVANAHHDKYTDGDATSALEPVTSALAASGVATDVDVVANTTLVTTTSGFLQSNIDAVEAGDVDDVNSVIGSVGIVGAGEVNVTTVGQTITISGTDHAEGGGSSARTYTASDGGTDQTISGTGETIITGLGNIAVPGTPDGAKKYRLNCSVPFIVGRKPFGSIKNPAPGALTVVQGASLSSGTDESLQLAASISCFVWWQPTSATANTDGAIFGAYNTSLDQNTIQLAYDKSKNEYVARVTHDLSTNARKYHYTGLSQVVGEWIFLGFTYTNPTLTLYVNGEVYPATQTENNTVAQTNNDNRHMVICQDEIADEDGAGLVHSAGMWATIMDKEEIRALYNAGRGDLSDWDTRWGNYISEEILRHYFRFGGEDTGLGPFADRTSGADLASDGSPTIDASDITDLFFATPRLVVHMGSNGNLTDAVVYSTSVGESPLTLNGLQVTPASGDKITLGFQGNGGGNIIHLGEQISKQFSFLEIEEI